MQIRIQFHSYFRDLTGCAESSEVLQPGQTVDDLLRLLIARFPRLDGMRNATLIAVGVDYQDRSYRLQEGDDVSLFPPVQGG